MCKITTNTDIMASPAWVGLTLTQAKIFMQMLTREASEMIPERKSLLEVMIGIHEGAGNQSDWMDAVNSVVQQGLEPRQQMPLRGVLLFATADWCEPNKAKPLSKLIRDKLKEQLHYEVPLIGGSMPKIFVSLPQREKKFYRITEGFVVIYLFSQNLWVHVGSFPQPYLSNPAARRDELLELKARLRDSRHTHLGLGSSASRDLFAIFPGPIVNETGERFLLDIELHDQLLEVFGPSMRIFGASAGNNIWPTKGFQFANDELLESSLAVALLEYDFEIKAAMTHGFTAITDVQVTVTKLADADSERSYIVEELDGKPAAERLREILAKCYEVPLPRPILSMGNLEFPKVLVPTQRLDEEVKGPIRFNRKVPRGHTLSVLHATIKDLGKDPRETFRKILPLEEEAKAAVKAAIGIACLSRFDYFDRHERDSWWKEAEKTAKTLENIPYVCALSAGEFAASLRGEPQGDHFSVWLSTLEGKPNFRARNRILQERLLDAANALISCREPQKVMKQAIYGAIYAGAGGGQICLCDPDMGMILGGESGYAYSAPRSGLKYEETLKTTFRAYPTEGEYYQLPEAISRWTIQTAPLPRDAGPELSSENANILTILCANRLAIYVPDSADPRFCNDPRGVQDGNLKSQFISALFGSSGQAIATLQVGFEENYPMDHESMGLWLGYAQTVAAALERAMESEDRNALEEIEKRANQTMQSPAPQKRLPEEEIREYLEVVKQVLGADYVHARIRVNAGPQFLYDLISTPNFLGAAHKNARPKLTSSTGSVGRASKQRETFTNNKDETRRIFRESNLPNPTISSLLTDEWEREMRSFRSCAILRLTDTQNLLSSSYPILGALVLDSKQEYFFTQHRKAIALFAARNLEVMIQKREADHVRANNDMQVIATGLLNASTLHDVLRPLGRIQRDIDLLRVRLPVSPMINELTDRLERHKNEAFEMLSTPIKSVDSRAIPMSGQELIEAARKQMKEQWQGQVSLTPLGKYAVVLGNFWLSAAIANLLDNAVQAANEVANGEIHVVVDVSNLGSLIITIINDGRLLTDEEFEDLRSIGKSTKRGGHLGIGIAIADCGIRWMGGELQFMKRSQGGLEARIGLPIHKKER